jgi:hypothetical protein
MMPGMTAPMPPPAQPLDPATRQAILNQALMAKAAAGFRVESQSGQQAVVVKPAVVNHAVHAILSLITCGLWLVVWLIVALSAKDLRQIIYVDDFGNVSEHFAASR